MVHGMVCKACPSAGGFHPLRSLTRRNRTKQCKWSGQRSIIRWKLTICKCQELHAPGNNPGATSMYRIIYTKEKTRREGVVLYRREIWFCLKSFECHLLAAAAYNLVGRRVCPGRFQFLRSCWEHNEMCIPGMLDIMWHSPTLSACLRCRCRALIGTCVRIYVLCSFAQGLLRCAVLCLQ